MSKRIKTTRQATRARWAAVQSYIGQYEAVDRQRELRFGIDWGKPFFLYEWQIRYINAANRKHRVLGYMNRQAAAYWRGKYRG